jgi:hypothetical protein
MTKLAALISLLALTGCAAPPVATESEADKLMRSPEHQRMEKLIQDKLASDSKARVCRNNPSSLVGLSRDAVIAKCGNFLRITRTATARSSSEQWVYNLPVDGILAVHFEGGVVTSASSY